MVKEWCCPAREGAATRNDFDGNGKAVAWLHRTVAPTIAAIFAPGANHEMPLELAMGAVDNPFAIANFRVENPEAAAHTRFGLVRDSARATREGGANRARYAFLQRQRAASDSDRSPR